MYIDPCLDHNVGRRRVFWTTRAGACGSYTMCGIECSIPGLVYENVAGDYPDPQTLPGSRGFRTINTDEWLQSLILNILNTRARTDARCPTPAAAYGHWSESYRDDNLYIGSTLWNAAEKSYVRTADAVKAIGAAIRADMGKLIALGIAETVEVEATYRGSNSVAVSVTVNTATGHSRIDLSGSFVSETWVWS
jgi:phage gp46-like protein